MALSGTMAAPDTPLPAFTAAAFSGACGTSARSTDLLQRLAETAAATWAAASGALGVAEPPPAQAALTFLLLLLLAAVGNDGVDRSGSLLRSILKGVNARLSRGMTDGPAARQGKRVARLFSELLAAAAVAAATAGTPAAAQAGQSREKDDFDGTLDAEEVPQVLYADEDLRLLPEELWWTPQPHPDALQHLAGGAAVARAAHAARSPVNLQEASAGDGPLTDSDDSDASSVASIEVAGGCVDDDGIGGGRALDLDKKWRPLQLHTVAAALRDSAKTVAQVDALQKLEQLVRASPATEVAKAAPELLRTLIYSPPPEWASQQTPAADPLHPHRRRLGSLAAVLAAAPHAAPGAAISHMFTEGLDVSQRLLVMDGLCAAACELAGRPLLQPLKAPLGPEGSAGAAPPARSAALLAGRYNPDKTRVWGTSTLRKLQDGPAAASPNRFAATALPWAMDLLTRAAEDSRGARLFRMQAVVFGRMLTTLGTFCHCARLTPEADRLCSVVMELLLDEPVTEHPDPFVRKSALVATAELLRAVPAPRLAGALMHRNGGGGSADDATFAARLERLQEHLRHTHADAPDATLRALAEGCLALQGQLAQEALACIQADSSIPAPALTSASHDILLPPW